MRAILLAAGFGTRLRPVTDHVPKALVPVDGRPLLEYWLEALFRSGCDRVLINTHYLADQVHATIAQSRFADRIDTVREEQLLGTAGTIRANAAFCQDEPCLIAHADNLCICDFEAFRNAHDNRPAGSVLTMMTFDAPDPSQCGIVELDDTGLLTAFHEKVPDPPGGRANAAVYIAEPKVIDAIAILQTRKPDISRDVIPRFLGQISTWHNDRYHMDIGTLQTYGLAQLDVRRHRGFMAEKGWFS